MIYGEFVFLLPSEILSGYGDGSHTDISKRRGGVKCHCSPTVPVDVTRFLNGSHHRTIPSILNYKYEKCAERVNCQNTLASFTCNTSRDQWAR